MPQKRAPKKPLEFEVKPYFHMLTSEAQRMYQEQLLVLSKPAIPAMQDLINLLGNHYRDVCYPAARGTQARLQNLDYISKKIATLLADFKEIRAALLLLEKAARKLNKKVTSKKTAGLAEKLWY